MKLNELAFKEIATKDMVPSKRILVRDQFGLLPDDARQNLRVSLIEESKDYLEQTRHATLVASIIVKNCNDKELLSSFAPVRLFRVFENTQEMDKREKKLKQHRIDLLNRLKRYLKQI